MTAHKHAEMIKAKADNMVLVVFFKCGVNDRWKKTESQEAFPVSQFYDVEYFLCLPQHEKECLHWLNGGEVVASDGLISTTNPSKEWSRGSIFMDDRSTFIIKPRTEIRYAAYNSDGTMRTKTFTNPDELVEYYYGEQLNIVSFEVEVK